MIVTIWKRKFLFNLQGDSIGYAVIFQKYFHFSHWLVFTHVPSHSLFFTKNRRYLALTYRGCVCAPGDIPYTFAVDWPLNTSLN